jgi:hypothetical protein
MALATVFDDVWLRDQTFASHPIGMQAQMRYGRWALFRLGVALSLLQVSDETRSRLRQAERYVECAAELDWGLFLALCGLKVEHEPLAPNRGPDYRVAGKTRAITFEVKCPNMSLALQAMERVAGMISMELQGMVTRLNIPRGWVIEPEISGPRLAKAAQDEADAQRLLTILRTGIVSWATAPKRADVQLDAGVSMSVRRRQAPGVQIWGPGFSGDAIYEAGRLVRHLEEAADQISAAGVPGFIVLAQERSSLLGNHMGALARAIRDDQTGLYRDVAGLIAYSVDASGDHSRLLAHAQVFLKHEHRNLMPLIVRMQRAGNISFRLF